MSAIVVTFFFHALWAAEGPGGPRGPARGVRERGGAPERVPTVVTRHAVPRGRDTRPSHAR